MSHENEDRAMLRRAKEVLESPEKYAQFEIDWAEDIIKLLGD